VSRYVPTATIINRSTSWKVKPCSLVDDCRSFEGTYYHHVQGRRVSRESDKQPKESEDAGSKFLRNISKSTILHRVTSPEDSEG
jgi:hypothetical protein